MKILVCGDVEARSGREAIEAHLPYLKKRYSIDFIVINVDNAAGGFGITATIAKRFFELGADVLTGGNHIFDQAEIIPFLATEKRLLRPHNMPFNTPGTGVAEITAGGKKIVVIHISGYKNMPIVVNDPFEAISSLLQKYALRKNADAIVVDFHAEVTSEKNAIGHFVDGRVSILVGTHTHIPTRDERILELGTAFQTDIGMCGDYDSVIGMNKQAAIAKFSSGYMRTKLMSATGKATFCGLLVELDDLTGLARQVQFIKLGGCIC
ncbi:MAG: YmdB family metallophosphoesterase [Holosporaceae bacterium]|jgi:metallophosphoesterase (TIGR00282 family)|nr:YmdB family metallophosphoesterase [Holosporaceae bacterium]